MRKIIWLPLFLLITILMTFSDVNASDEVILDAAKKELERSMTELKNEENPPYYISYNITDSKKTRITSSFGDIKSNNSTNQRILDIDLRVGNYKFDNTHIIRGQSFSFSFGGGMTLLPLGDNEKAIRSAIWYATDRTYKDAIERYEKALTNKKVKVMEEDTSADFSHEIAYHFRGKSIKYNLDLNKWKAKLKKLSALFNGYGWIYQGDVVLITEELTKYFVNSEGSDLSWDESYIRMYVNVMTKADDGMSLPLYKSYFAYEPGNLPEPDSIAKDIKQMIALLDKMRTAPMMTTYSGPAILSGEAAGVFFHEIFGHRVEGHREKDPNSSQTFKQSVGKEILPPFINVTFDPTRRTLRGREISGYYDYDDEGIKAQKVVSVDKGIFKNFLMSRSPIEDFPKSNGHGRKQAGYSAVSRQSNLIVESSKTVSLDKLKELLREECKKQDKEYGLYFETVQGGFTYTGRTVPNAFNVQPIVVYKIFADGRPDELVRGVDLIGTPLTTFSNIIATGDDLGIFNGVCGAESGGVPVSACSPSLLISKIEVQKKKKSQAKPPLLPAP